MASPWDDQLDQLQGFTEEEKGIIHGRLLRLGNDATAMRYFHGSRARVRGALRGLLYDVRTNGPGPGAMPINGQYWTPADDVLLACKFLKRTAMDGFQRITWSHAGPKEKGM